MALQFSTVVRNAMLDSIETTVGVSALIQIWAGAVPGNAGTAIGAQTKLVEFALASDWASAASGGSKAFLNTPLSVTAVGSGTATFFRITNSAGTTCHVQGNVGTSGADLNLDNVSINSGQTVQIVSWTINAPGA